ncbi:unnamed protein product [Ectocarpus sp. 8 AP-2014]
MFEDAEGYFSRLPGSFYGKCSGGDEPPAGWEKSDMPSLSAEDLIMAVHKASSRRIEVLSRTTGNVDQMVEGYEWQLKILTARSPPGLSVSTAVHAASVGEERFKKGDCRGASRILRLAFQAIGGDVGSGPAATASDPQAAHTGKLRRTILFSLAHCCSKSGDHNNAIKFIKHLEEGGGWCAKGGGTDPPSKFLFAKCKVLTDAGDLTGAYTAAKALVALTPAPSGKPTAGVGDGEPEDRLDLAAARLISSREDCSDRSLDLFAAIASRFAGTPKAVDARVALLSGLAMAARLRSEGGGAGWWSPDGQHEKGSAAATTADNEAVARVEKTADDMIAEISECNSVATSQVDSALEVLVTFTEFFQGRDKWELCARWCGRAINLAKGDSKGSTPKRVPHADKASLLLASLLTLRGEMECRTGDFVSSSQTLDQALALCPTYGRAREVAFWSAARDPNRDESSLSARLSALSGPRARLTPGARREYLATCVGLVAGVRKATQDPDQRGESDAGDARCDGRVTMVQERLLEALLLEVPATTDMTKETEPAQAQPSTSSTPHEAGSDKDGPAGSATVGSAGEDCGGLAPTPMVVEGEGDEDVGDVPVARTGADATPSGNRSEDSNGNGTDSVPTAVQVVASMVDSALQWVSKEEIKVHGGSAEDAASVLSRVLLSVDKTLGRAGSLGIGPLDDPDIQYLSHSCWNLAVRCCGSSCDLPWGDKVGSSASKDQMSVDEVTHTGSKRNDLLVLAPAFFKASRNWAEIGSDANMEDALLRRQNCVVLSIAATLELHDSKPVDDAPLANVTMGLSERRDMLERSRKEVEVATGLNRLLSDVKPDMATEMRPILLVAEMNVLGRLGDFVAVRSLIASREPDFLRCSTNLLRYCLQLAEDMLDDAKSTAGLCRLCIRRCVEEDPVDTCALGGFYRRLLVSASSREEALVVVDEFTAKSRDLQEGPGMPSDDVDYVSAKCYNLGLQLLEMSRPGEAERFVGKALGLLKLGSSPAFVRRWEEAIHKVYRITLQAKGDAETATNPIMAGGSGSQASTAIGGRAFLSTGLFPMP